VAGAWRHAVVPRLARTLGIMIEVLGLILAVLGILLAFQAPRQFILNWLPRSAPAKEAGLPVVSVGVVEWQRGLQTYDLSFRISNRNTSGTPAISRCIFLEVFAVRQHPLEIDKVFYGAPVTQVKGESSLYNIRAKVGLWTLFREPRTFPPNEVEDFHVTIRFEDGFAYAVRVGMDWYSLDDTTQSKKRELSGFFAVCSPLESRSAPSETDDYIPPTSFVNRAVPLKSSADFDQVNFGDPANDA
jgi:hypothetical protein